MNQPESDLTRFFLRHFAGVLHAEPHRRFESGGEHPQILVYAPTALRPSQIITTLGLSAASQAVPNHQQDVDPGAFYPDECWTELMLSLPADWPVITDLHTENAWPARLLHTAQAARTHRQYLGEGQIFKSTAPYSSDLDWTAAVLEAPRLLGSAAHDFRGPCAERCTWLAVIPLSPTELSLRLNQPETFRQQLGKAWVTEVIDVARPTLTTVTMRA